MEPEMSDYDAAFTSASQGPAASPYDEVMKSLMAEVKPMVVPENAPVAVKAGATVNNSLSSIPRQLGLTARYALEGPAQAAQIFTEPVAGLMRMAGIKTKSLGEMASGLADSIGLPTPQGANERVIGDATRLVAGGAGMAGAAGAASSLPGVAGKVFAGLAANPLQQLSAAAGAGALGSASREAGGSGFLQAGAALVGGLAGGVTPGAIGGAVNAGRRLLTPAMTPQQIDIQLTSVLGQAGTDFRQLSGQVQNQLRDELRSSLQIGKPLDPMSVSRLADFKAVGATPTRGMISQNPVQITREMNLAKMAANSSDDTLQGLPLMQNQNNSALIQSMNGLGAGSEALPITAGRMVTDRIGATQQGLRSAEKTAWNAAKTSPGYTQPIYPDGLNAMNRALGDEGMMPFMSKQITDYMAAFQTGKQPFTPQAYRNLQSMLSNEMTAGGNTAAAAKIARNALESTPMKPITNPGGIDFGTAPVTSDMAAALRQRDGMAGQAIDLVNQARGATRSAYRYEESSPLVRSVLADGRSSDPEKIAQSFIMTGTVNDARAVAQEVGPQGVPAIRDALATYIKKQSLSNMSDEVGKVSQSRLNSTLKSIGDEKLALFFSPTELKQLKATGRVAALMQVQPVGSAVNNSNSGALLLGRGMDLLNQIPFAGPMVGPALKNIGIGINQRQAQNYLPGLLAEQPNKPLLPGLLLPALAAGGGLLSP
jgi:hypothetical protein